MFGPLHLSMMRVRSMEAPSGWRCHTRTINRLLSAHSLPATAARAISRRTPRLWKGRSKGLDLRILAFATLLRRAA